MILFINVEDKIMLCIKYKIVVSHIRKQNSIVMGSRRINHITNWIRIRKKI